MHISNSNTIFNLPLIATIARRLYRIIIMARFKSASFSLTVIVAIAIILFQQQPVNATYAVTHYGNEKISFAQ
jgi:hypothetical protein